MKHKFSKFIQQFFQSCRVFQKKVVRCIGQKIIHTQWLRRMAAIIITGYLHAVRKSCSLKIHHAHHMKSYKNRPVIVAFWHNRMVLAPFAWEKDRPFFMMIADYSDGRIASEVIRLFGLHTLGVPKDSIQKSITLKQALRHLKEGHTVGITPDGPSGPCYQAHKGIFSTALMSGCDVLVLSYATSHYMRLKTWDRLFIPLPFGKGHLIWSEPLAAPTHKNQESAFLSQLTDTLNNATQNAHVLAGIASHKPYK